MGIPVLPFCELEKSTLDWKIRAYVQDIQTIGDHIKVKRLQKGLLQIDVAKLLGVTEDCITCWENNRSQPMVHFMPTIIEFLGYVPIEIDPSTFGGKLNEYRIRKGITLKNMAKIAGADPTTISNWEKNISSPRENQMLYLNKILAN